MLSGKFYVFGLDQAGKSVFVYFLTTGQVTENLPPTLAFSVKDLHLKKLKIMIYDAPGQKIFRNTWLKRVNRSDLIFFLVDLTQKERFAEAKEELDKILAKFPKQGAAPVVVCFHKVDRPVAKRNLQEAREVFDLQYIDNRKIYYFETSAYQPKSIKAVYNLLEKLFGTKKKGKLSFSSS